MRRVPDAGALVSDADLQSLGLVPVYRREDSILVAYSTERDLRKFDAQVSSYSALRKKLSVLAKIETATPWTREDRTSPRLNALKLESDREYTVDLLLLPLDWSHQNTQAPAAIEKFVVQHPRRTRRLLRPPTAPRARRDRVRTLRRPRDQPAPKPLARGPTRLPRRPCRSKH